MSGSVTIIIALLRSFARNGWKHTLHVYILIRAV